MSPELLHSIRPALFVLGATVVSWTLMILLLRSQGWYALARAFPYEGLPREQVRMQSLGIGKFPMNNAATIGWDEEKLYVSVSALLTLGILPFFPPFAIPFKAIKSRRRYRQLGKERDELEIDAGGRIVRLLLPVPLTERFDASLPKRPASL
jgi:hypothetical protein